MRTLLVVALLSIATSSVALDRPQVEAPKVDWVLYAGAVEDSSFAWQERYWDLRVEMVECEDQLWRAGWESSEEDAGRSWWKTPALLLGAAVAGYCVGAASSR